MNDAKLHLLTNHLPIIIPIVGMAVLIGGFIFRSPIVKRVAFVIFVFGALCTIPAYVTGEGAEEVVEHMPGIDEVFIEEHEELAETFAILSYLLGSLSIVGFWLNLRQKSSASIAAYAILVLAVIVFYFGVRTGTSGGEVRHTEIRDSVNDISQPH
jgi:uncharacterized membrane protein